MNQPLPKPQPLILHNILQLAPPALHREVWEAAQAKRWYFGNYSVEPGAAPFWKMDLEDSAPVTRLWEHAKEQCEQKVGHGLRVVRQYANGHTYGQGGRPHVDDVRERTYTLLYYPMLEWKSEWEGETMWVSKKGDLLAVVNPLPNRAVLFDARIPHYGRAPARAFVGLRITIAFKLESV